MRLTPFFYIIKKAFILEAKFCVINIMAEILRPIYIEKTEGVGSILTRVQKTSESRLALVFPPDSSVFHNVLEVEFLKKELDKLGKEAVIITSDKAQAELARGLGFKSSEDIQHREQADNFLKDFYGEEKKQKAKIISPLISPRISDVVSKKPAESSSINIKVNQKREEEKQQIPPQEEKSPEISPYREEKKAYIPEEKDEEIKLKTSSRLQPISLTEDDLAADGIVKPETKRHQKKIHLPKFPRFSFAKFSINPLKKIFIVLLISAVGIFVLGATFVFPRAEIKVQPAREQAQLNIDVSFDSHLKTVDFDKNIVPSQIFEVSKTVSQEFPATKETNISQKAQGVITIYNAYSSQPQTLVRTTRFRAPDGKVFRLIKTITVPGAKIEGGTIIPSSIDAKVVADQPGAAYNIGPTDFTIPGFKGTDKYKGFYGKSKAAMKGGLVKKGLVVGEDDVKSAEKKLQDKLLSGAKIELKKQLGSDFQLIDKSLRAEITEVKTVPKVGEPADKFALSIKAVAKGFAYKRKSLNDLIEEKIALKLSDKRISLPDTQKISFTPEGIDYSAGTADFNLLVKEDISWKIKDEHLKEVLAGKNEEEAQQAIKLFSEIKMAKVSLWPFWLKRIPKDPRKITITVDY